MVDQHATESVCAGAEKPMNKPESKPVPLAIRLYPQLGVCASDKKRRDTKWSRPDSMLVFDTETRTDAAQRLTFGSYRFYDCGECVEEGLFYANDLPHVERLVLEAYVAQYPADVVAPSNRRLKLLTLRQFTELLFNAAYRGRSVIVGFNLPFDLARIASDATAARGRFAGGFSLGIWTYVDGEGNEQRNQYRPRIGIKHIDSKRALKGFTARKKPDEIDLIPEGSPNGKPQKGYKFRGNFLDLRTLAFSLTDRGYSLADACKQLGVEHGKQKAARHGKVTAEYVDYNRRDVLATAELAFKLLVEYYKHPITLPETKAYSPASIGKDYLHAMGISPILRRQPDFPKCYLGYAATAFFGGRTSAHIRKICVPIVYTDFLSMYPTVNSLMGLWPFVVAKKIEVVEHCQTDIEDFLSGLKIDELFNPDTWKNLTAFVKIIPDGDILPSRAKYSLGSNDWQVGINRLYTTGNDPIRDALWFSLPDVFASIILTGRMPKIVDAFRIEAHGALDGLQPTKLRGSITVDPAKQDFFRIVIEERKRLSKLNVSDAERERLDKALKVLANATSYGIYAEMNRTDADEETTATCYGLDPNPFTCRVAHPDNPGEYCFTPLASLITGGARLMLALLEACVTDLGGTYAMEDTDSMAIVATESGGIISIARPHIGNQTIKALSWEQVRNIANRFAALNPYDREAIPGSILKIEDDNFDAATGAQRQLYCLAISAKRYALFIKNERNRPALLRKGVNNKQDRWSKHGLGHLLNPTDPESNDRDWTGQAWLNIVREALGRRTERLGFENLPAIGRITVSSPAIMKALQSLNHGKPYAEQIKPFNFILTAHVKPLGHPIETDASRFHLIGPYEADPKNWLTAMWIDQYSGKLYRITTTGHHGDRISARVKTYGELIREYLFHPEAKCADSEGNVCGKQTTGLLQRRHVWIERVHYIGKESNSLEEVEAGSVHKEDEVYTEYVDPSRDDWATVLLPALKKFSLAELVEGTSLSRRALIDLRADRSRPHPKNQAVLARFLHKAGHS